MELSLPENITEESVFICYAIYFFILLLPFKSIAVHSCKTAVTYFKPNLDSATWFV